MSFGFSVGDFIRVFELARDTYHDCRHAPSQFQDAGRGADSLRIVLEGIHAEIRNPSSILHRNERTATDFAMCAKRSRVGGNLSSILSDHSNDEKGVWKDLRSRLISEGIKSRSITENESAIVERIQEL
ncbi:hypothetical protein P152DRAFT_370813, partial [Eremomyces bilateralis CBS 781.70]